MPQLIQSGLGVAVCQYIAEIADLPPRDHWTARLQFVQEVGSGIGQGFYAAEHSIPSTRIEGEDFLPSLGVPLDQVNALANIGEVDPITLTEGWPPA